MLKRAFPYLLLAALTLVFLYKIALTGMILGRGDVFSYFYPYWAAKHAALQAGRIPLWTPDVFMGVPLLANSQIGLFYPLNWPLTPFDAPNAVTISVLAHLYWALLGVYYLARRRWRLGVAAALAAALTFGFGGYIGAKIENINQLQALAWLGWIFLALPVLPPRVMSPHPTSPASEGGVGTDGAPIPSPFMEGVREGFDKRLVVRTIGGVLPLAVCLALQFLAGHPQTAFITVVGLGLYALAVGEGWRGRARSLLLLAVAGMVMLVLIVPQLLPTAQMSALSNRGGGMDAQQAMAFSLNPFLFGRGLLPSYDGVVFGEYIAYIGVIGLGLALIGAWGAFRVLWRGRVWVLLLLVGLLLALGRGTFIYTTLATLPGFNAFRVPARWLALSAFSAALLVGLGVETLRLRRPPAWVWGIVALIIGLLAGLSFLADRAADEMLGAALPTTRTLIGWALAALALVVAVRSSSPDPYPNSPAREGGVGTDAAIIPSPRAGRVREGVRGAILLTFLSLELFFAARIMPYNEVVPPDTFTARRFTISQLQAYAAEVAPAPLGRVLSISQINFDPGDNDALIARYQALGMSDFATRLALVDTKLREIIAPNQSLLWGIPSVDGFDGGLLPSADYSAFTLNLLPEGSFRTTDGRLREHLSQQGVCARLCIPNHAWLNVINAEFLITDKVFDLVQDGIFYDTAIPVDLAADASSTALFDPPLTANRVDILYTGATPPSVTANGEALTMSDGGMVGDYQRALYALDAPSVLESVTVTATDALQFRAVSAVDTRNGVFQQAMLDGWQRVLSSDVKLYRNTQVLARAIVVTAPPNPLSSREDGAAIAALQSSTANQSGAGAAVTFLAYQPERVALQVDAPQGGYLVLTDAYDPNWIATVDGQSVPISRAWTMFRAVPVPAGASTVEFAYRPAWWPSVLWFGAVVWAGVIAVMLWLRRRPHG